ncbi:MAG: GNAT family N-acetyltransferase [Bacteroidales bacterium]
MEKDPIKFKKCGIEDIPIIQSIAREIFPDTFASILKSDEQLDFMMNMMYGDNTLTRDISSGAQNFYLAFLGDKPCGYISITTPDYLDKEKTDPTSPANLPIIKKAERPIYILHKVYLSKEMHGRGVGRQLWKHAVDIISDMAKGKPVMMLLQVNRENPAVKFYEHLGMKKVVKYDFVFDHGYEMNDYVMTLDIN